MTSGSCRAKERELTHDFQRKERRQQPEHGKILFLAKPGRPVLPKADCIIQIGPPDSAVLLLTHPLFWLFNIQYFTSY